MTHAPETSRAAAASIDANKLRAIVYGYLKTHGGATDEEMQELIPMPPNTQRPRRCELVERNFVRDSGERRKTKSGRDAVVWVVA